MDIRQVLARLRERWRPVLIVHIFFSLAGLAILAPLFSLTLRALLNLTGRAAAADQDIALLLLTPAGLIGGIFLAALWLAIFSLELGALLAIAVAADHDKRLRPGQAIAYALHNALRLLQLTTLLTLRVLIYLLPFLLALWLVANALLRDHDINYYLTEHPPQFMVALGLAGLCALLLFWFLGRRLLDWSLALPLTLLGESTPRDAFATSTQLTRDTAHRRQFAGTLLGWLAAAALLTLVPPLLLTAVAAALIGLVAENLPLLVVLLGATMLCWVALNVVASGAVLGSFAFALSALYERLGPPLSNTRVSQDLQASNSRVSGWSGTGITVAIVVAAALATAAGLLLLRGIELEDETLVIAHRGAAGAAPENTLAAIERALQDGADWVEIDVQESRDGEVVVVHDSDFMKLAGNPLKVWDGTLADIQEIDVGSWFGSTFADQRVPTLREVLTTVRGRAKLVIELKYYGHDIKLEQRVIDVVEAQDMADQVVLMSLKLEGVQKAKALRPDWTAGLLAATAVGDLTRLDVDFLAVSAGLAKRGFVRRARSAGKPVFVWTINDAISLSDWMSRGVAGVITDEPALAREVLLQRAQLTTVQRLILSTAGLLGKSRAPGSYRDQSP